MHKGTQKPIVHFEPTDRRIICKPVRYQVPLDAGPAQIRAIDKVVLFGELPVTLRLTDTVIELSLGTGGGRGMARTASTESNAG